MLNDNLFNSTILIFQSKNNNNYKLAHYYINKKIKNLMS